MNKVLLSLIILSTGCAGKKEEKKIEDVKSEIKSDTKIKIKPEQPIDAVKESKSPIEEKKEAETKTL